jgi:hypothetical protein
MATTVRSAATAGDHWLVQLYQEADGRELVVKVRQVINATYSATNAVNALFGQPAIGLMHEITEMAFVTSPQLANTGLTIMDGPFGSIMPYGKSGLLSLSSVPYTHHKVSYEPAPVFDCQASQAHCSPGAPGICTGCAACPPSNYRKMLAQISQYLSERVELRYFTSTYTIKSKLQSSYIDDGRPTEISIMRRRPHYYCIFAGKINSIYEIEKVVEL